MRPLFDNGQYMTELAIRNDEKGNVEKLFLLAEIHPTNEAMHLYTVPVKVSYDDRFAYCEPSHALIKDTELHRYLGVVEKPKGGYGDYPYVNDILTVIFGGMATSMGTAFLLRSIMVHMWHTDERFREQFESAITDFGGKRHDDVSSTVLNLMGKGAKPYHDELTKS